MDFFAALVYNSRVGKGAESPTTVGWQIRSQTNDAGLPGKNRHHANAQNCARKMYWLHAMRVGVLVGANRDVSAIAKPDSCERF